MLVVLWSPVILRVRLALLHTASPNTSCPSHIIIILLILMHSLASIPLLLIMEDKGGPTPGHKTKIWFCSMEAGTSAFTIFGKSEWVEEIYRARLKHQLFYYKQNLGYTTSLLFSDACWKCERC